MSNQTIEILGTKLDTLIERVDEILEEARHTNRRVTDLELHRAVQDAVAERELERLSIVEKSVEELKRRIWFFSGGAAALAFAIEHFSRQ